MASKRPLSREESKLITRRRLLDAAVKILGRSGYGALSVSAVAREAGIAQPTFYVHFADKDDLVRTVAQERIETIRVRLREARRNLVRDGSIDALRETFRLPLRALLESPELFRLYIQEYYQPGSPFGEQARRHQRELEQDLVDDLLAQNIAAETPADRERMMMMAEGMIALTQTLGFGYIEGRYTDLEAIVDVLAQFALGVLAPAGNPD
jgi:AcrR family transcriptional regulator